ncbi:hypothetical protein HMPREF1318_0516 [Actinomyces massiliensis F0489]|uniref:Uncharacterized protein n=1 Tax=Actinomyces massiliensis F0489 TaxID=1125718 RepID=J0NIY3_9ACTO|nr:hypothetical protein HMPREF1318_0516 [Actinomyces massiliensis F0489]
MNLSAHPVLPGSGSVDKFAAVTDAARGGRGWSLSVRTRTQT